MEDKYNHMPIENYFADRNKALCELDIEWAKRQLIGAGIKQPSDETVLVSLHKTRYETTNIPAELRHASRAWLEERGHDRLMGVPWPPPGILERRVTSDRRAPVELRIPAGLRVPPGTRRH